jgi:hypothetical protein
MLTVPSPRPVSPPVMSTQVSSVTASHSHEGPVETPTLAVPPAGPREVPAAESTNGQPASIFSLTVVLRLTPPEMPVIVGRNVPDVALAATSKVRRDTTRSPGGGVTGFAEKLAVTPAGKPATLRVTGLLKVPALSTRIFTRPDSPVATVSFRGLGLTVNWMHSGLANEAMRVLQLKDPFAVRYSVVYQKVQSSSGSTAIAL